MSKSIRSIPCFALLLFAALFLPAASAAAAEAETREWPTAIFHNFGKNWLGSVTYNYGLNLVAGGLGTWAMIETGLDWKLRTAASKQQWLVAAGMPQLIIGQFVPVLTPLTLYLAGKSNGDRQLVSTAAALSQALLITLSIQTPMKMITGRESLHLMHNRWAEPSTRTDDFSGEFDWFNMDFMRGWPSGHTANSFAAAAVLSEMYSSVTWLKIVAYSYAAIMGISMASSVHWASDVFAGALIGYAVGKTVGRSFSRPQAEPRNIEPALAMNMIGVSFRI